ncbi:hypothetical protein [Halorubrum distributum]|uniref:Uncharacterized protein n=1 Tax=Halorubrum distributum JCM 10247 TaxID=1227486 RepID=M0D5J5_9EURY|nr:hypothetical protein [Halorubrum terrestre]ELZ30118.1 hypothetical protein C473_13409 [Halorubrum terrestre JCM 10247]
MTDIERRVVDAERPLTGVTYGPTVDDDGYVLTLITAEGPLEVEFDEEAMYLLWTEVKGTPWLDPPTSTERDLLAKRLVELANGADEEMLKDAIRALGGER